MPTDHLSLCGHTLDGKYRVDALVAEGGFGVVYRAVHVRLKKPVALKVLKLKGLESERERPEVIALFTAEAETAAKLDHPAIVKVLDFGVSPMPDGVEAPWMVLDWVQGITLADDLRTRRETPGRAPSEVLTMLRPVLAALAKAHAMGVVHRDIKPRNLMLTPQGDGDAWASDETPVKILDFGIAKDMSANEGVPVSGDTWTKSVTVAFSMRYAAPEQVSGTRTGPWTDVYQMGLVITELLTNQTPYRGDDAMEVHMQIMGTSRPTPAQVDVDVGSWEAVLARALAVKPSDRYANARELLDELVAMLPANLPPPRASKAPSELASTRGAAVPDQSSTLRPSTAQVRLRSRRTARRWLLPIAGAAALGGAVLMRTLSSEDGPTGAPTPRRLAAASIAIPMRAHAPEPAAPTVDAAPAVTGALPTATSDAGASVAQVPDAQEAATSTPAEHPTRHGSRHERHHPSVLIAPIRVN